MIETQANLVAASSCGATSVSTGGGAQAAGATALAAARITDVLVTALDPAGLAGLQGLGQGCACTCRPPRRPSPTGGYAGGAPARGTVVSVPAPKTRRSSTSKTSSSSSSSKTSGPLGFLNDPKLSVEDKLFKFMCYVADKYDKALEKKMNEIANKQTSTSTSKKSGGGGLLGGILGGGGGAGGLLGGILGGGGGGGGLLGGLLGGSGGVSGLLGSVFPAAGIGLDLLGNSGVQDVVTQLSGPVLAAGATCLGFPEFAPALLKAGPELAQGAFGLLGSATGGGSGSSASGSSGSSSSSSTGGDPKIEQKDMHELQQLMDKQKEMFSLVSNMLRSMHDTKLAVINNLRA